MRRGKRQILGGIDGARYERQKYRGDSRDRRMTVKWTHIFRFRRVQAAVPAFKSILQKARAMVTGGLALVP
jgi:hypothetical protein